ncbi:MAG: methylenetetrahydrofolate reductase, partial [Candidatus Hermodarchaeota archaeon]
PGSCACFSSLVASYLVQKNTGMEAVYQLRCSDRNRLALTSDLLGAAALGIRNVLALTGDHTLLGDMPNAKPVFDLDSTQLIYMIRKMIDDGVDLNGKNIEHPPKFHVGGGANPNSKPLEPELLKIRKKVKVGAEFLQTQVVFDIETVKNFMDEVKRYDVPVLIGIFPLKSYGVADYFDKTVPGVKVPKELMIKMAKAKDIDDKRRRRETYNEINLDYFVKFVKGIKTTTSAAGCHIMSVGYEEIVPSLVEAIH